jgi:hypothetical protein
LPSVAARANQPDHDAPITASICDEEKPSASAGINAQNANFAQNVLGNVAELT